MSVITLQLQFPCKRMSCLSKIAQADPNPVSKCLLVIRVVLFLNPFFKNITENNTIEIIFREIKQLGESPVSLATHESITTMAILDSPVTLAAWVKKWLGLLFSAIQLSATNKHNPTIHKFTI